MAKLKSLAENMQQSMKAAVGEVSRVEELKKAADAKLATALKVFIALSSRDGWSSDLVCLHYCRTWRQNSKRTKP